MSGTAIVAGVGPGIGGSCVRRFAREGYTVGAIARSEERLRDLATRTDGPGEVVPVPADLADPASVRAGVERLRSAGGPVELVVYNAAVSQGTEPFLDTDLSTLRGLWAVDVEGLFVLTQEVLPEMTESGGTIIVTGSTLGPTGHRQMAPQSTRGAQRNLTLALAKEFAPQGVHVAYAIIDGYVDREPHRAANPEKPDDEWIDPDAVAETYHSIHTQPASGWTFQVDIRPNGGEFEAY